ncbi:MAG: tetratricopeptide repeat protein [Bacteroidetes bacterium]|nr:tetratricopeptide repeat protein [Bacteroidota bacterium]
MNFKQISILPIFIFVLCAIVLNWRCDNKKQESTTKVPTKQVVLSKRVDALMKDTTSYNPVVDSLKKVFNSLDDTLQILLLNELSENWRPFSFYLAQEALEQSKTISFPYGEAASYSKFGIYYYRKHDKDSSAYFLNKALEMANARKWQDIAAEALSWKGEALRWAGEKDSALKLLEEGLSIAMKTNDLKRAAFCLMSEGEAYRGNLEFEKAFDCYSKSISYSTQINDVYKIILCNNSIADIYRIKGDYIRSIATFQKTRELAKKNGIKVQLAFSLQNIGNIYEAQKDFAKALQYYKEAIKIAIESKDQLRVSNIYNKMGVAYEQMNNYDMAIGCYERSKGIAEAIGSYDNMAEALTNIGSIHYQKKNTVKALQYYNEAYDIAKETENQGKMCDVLYAMAECYFVNKDLVKAKEYSQKSLKIAQENNLLPVIKMASQQLGNIYQLEGNYKKALEMISLHIIMKDSLGNEDKIKEFAEVEYKAKEEGLRAEQYAKEQMVKAERAREAEELKRQKTIRYAFTLGFCMVLILAIVIYRGLRVNKKQNRIITAQKKEVEHQKELVDEKNKEITDSITYAKRLQEAILPPQDFVNKYLPHNFILYKPKDIVAGDFYWAEKINDLFFIAAADSTGHGVPGAMVSVVCSNALNRSVKEFKITETGLILDKTRELVLETFEKSTNEVKDGMDISLLCVDLQKRKVYWSGANNPLWFISDNQLNEIKADKQPIGKSDYPKPFSTHEIEYKENTTFYLFTDGIADQFGGPKGKKFKYKQFSDLLLQYNNLPQAELTAIIDKNFEDWKGALEQVDDVCVIGIRL